MRRSLAATALVAAALAGGALVFRADGDVDCSTYRFDRAAWSSGIGGDYPTPRRQEAGGLVECGVLDGRAPRDVRRLLGAPNRTYGTSWHYPLGLDPLGIDSEVLVVSFTGGRVSDAVVAQT